jgi:hypothetical protein
VVGPHGPMTDHAMGALFNSCIQLEITTNWEKEDWVIIQQQDP